VFRLTSVGDGEFFHSGSFLRPHRRSGLGLTFPTKRVGNHHNSNDNFNFEILLSACQAKA
jgi:hypothetical protein